VSGDTLLVLFTALDHILSVLLISFIVIKTFYSLDDLRVACKVRLENVETAERAGQVKQ
jgi:hypothetical protein